MRRAAIGALLMATVLTGCAKAPEGGGGDAKQELAVAEAPAPDAGKAGDAAIKVALPQIAYTYRYGFTLPAAEIARVQDAHIALCDRLGPLRCRIGNMDRASGDARSGNGTLTLAISAPLARRFGRALEQVVSAAGGERAGSSIAAEDLSKQIVDTEARLRAKQALADRLVALLQTRSGPVADLIAAERGVADVQEEIDAARSWLAEARGRVAMSTFELTYSASNLAGAGFIEPLRSSFTQMSGLFGGSIGLLILAVAVLLPWAVVIGVIAFAVRWFRRRRASTDIE